MTDEQVAVLAAATFLADRTWATVDDVQYYAQVLYRQIQELKENDE